MQHMHAAPSFLLQHEAAQGLHLLKGPDDNDNDNNVWTEENRQQMRRLLPGGEKAFWASFEMQNSMLKHEALKMAQVERDQELKRRAAEKLVSELSVMKGKALTAALKKHNLTIGGRRSEREARLRTHLAEMFGI